LATSTVDDDVDDVVDDDDDDDDDGSMSSPQSRTLGSLLVGSIVDHPFLAATVVFSHLLPVAEAVLTNSKRSGGMAGTVVLTGVVAAAAAVLNESAMVSSSFFFFLCGGVHLFKFVFDHFL
jgi:hypothetical protein